MKVDIRTLDEVDSTQDELFRLAASGAPPGTVVRARRQTRGRGRLGRTWISPDGGLYFSLLAEAENSSLLLLPLIAGLATTDIIRDMGAHALIKWPNDVIADNRKLAGILCEARDNRVAIGVGVNVRRAPIETAVSLADLMNDVPEPDVLLDRWLDAFSARRDRDDTAAEVEARLYGRNEDAYHAGDIVHILGVEPDGALLVNSDYGEKKITSGEVTPHHLFSKATLS